VEVGVEEEEDVEVEAEDRIVSEIVGGMKEV
jgi:hypothetical protein